MPKKKPRKKPHRPKSPDPEILKSPQIRDRILGLRRIKASELKPSPRNWRNHPETQRAALRGVLAQIGYAGACLARQLEDGSLELVDGHLRVEETPDQEIPVLILDVSEEEAATLIATLDPIAGMAEASQDVLEELLSGVKTTEPGLQALLDELAREIPSPLQNAGASRPRIEEADQLRDNWQTAPGQVWEIPGKGGSHRIVCGDSLRADFGIEGFPDLGSIDGVCTDPPFDMPGNQVRDAIAALGDVAVVVCADKIAFELAHYWAMRLDFICVHKTPRMMRTKAFPILYHLHCLVLTRTPRIKTGWSKPDPQFGSVIEADYEPSPCGYAKSPELAAQLLRGFGWQTVADPFLGSGSTIAACEQLGRVGLGIEIDPKYAAVALQRLADMGLEPRLSGPGRPQKRQKKRAREKTQKRVS